MPRTKCAQTKKGVNDTGYASKAGDGDADRAIHRTLFGVFIQVDRGKNSNRRDKEKRTDDEIKSADERRPEAASLSFVDRIVPDVVPGKQGRGFGEDVHQDHDQRDDQDRAETKHDPFTPVGAACLADFKV
jgi:hypothetical protein